LTHHEDDEWHQGINSFLHHLNYKSCLANQLKESEHCFHYTEEDSSCEDLIGPLVFFKVHVDENGIADNRANIKHVLVEARLDTVD
jgi:hypothetical protein